jgi:hypothetical protein
MNDKSPDVSKDVSPDVSKDVSQESPVVAKKTAKKTIKKTIKKPTSSPKTVLKVVGKHLQFFAQFLDYIGKRQPEKSAASLNNVIKQMIKEPGETPYEEVLTKFKEHRTKVHPTSMLQATASLSPADRARVEVVTTSMYMLCQKRDMNKNMNLDYVRKAVKDDSFVNWLAKKIAQ